MKHISQFWKLELDVFIHRSSKLVREINLEKDIKNSANTFKTSSDSVFPCHLRVPEKAKSAVE